VFFFLLLFFAADSFGADGIDVGCQRELPLKGEQNSKKRNIRKPLLALYCLGCVSWVMLLHAGRWGGWVENGRQRIDPFDP
jgi:hypothetical protein